jgi:hypothetical protein
MFRKKYPRFARISLEKLDMGGTFHYNLLTIGFFAGVAQLVEYKLPKLGVAGSNPVTRFCFNGSSPPE